jgi:integrase
MRPRGHIRDRGNGAFDLIVYLGVDERTGQKKYKSHRFKGTKKAAAKELNRLQGEVDDGGYVEPSNETLDAYLKQWLDGLKIGVTAKTHENAGYCVKYVTPHMGRRPLGSITPAHLRSLYATLLESGKLKGQGGLSPNSVALVHRVLKAALEQAVEDGLLRTNPARKVKPPKAEEETMSVLDEQQTRALLLAARGTCLYVPIVLAATTALRRGEVLGLRWQDLHLEAATLTVAQQCGEVANERRLQAPKTRNSRRTIRLPRQTIEALRAWRVEQLKARQTLADRYHDHGLVVCRQDGKPYSPAGFSSWFRMFLREVGLPQVRFHDLRHTHLSQLLDQGAQLTEVAARAGHSNPAITLRLYAHRIKGAEERMVATFEERFGLMEEETGTE